MESVWQHTGASCNIRFVCIKMFECRWYNIYIYNISTTFFVCLLCLFLFQSLLLPIDAALRQYVHIRKCTHFLLLHFFLFSFSNLTNTCKSCFVLTCIASDSDLLFIVLVVLGNSRGIHIYYVLHYGVMARVLTSMMSSYFLKHCGAYKTHRMIVKKCWSFVVPPNTLHIQNEDSRMTWRVGSAKISPAFARHLSSTKRLPF